MMSSNILIVGLSDPGKSTHVKRVLVENATRIVSFQPISITVYFLITTLTIFD